MNLVDSLLTIPKIYRLLILRDSIYVAYPFRKLQFNVMLWAFLIRERMGRCI